MASSFTASDLFQGGDSLLTKAQLINLHPDSLKASKGEIRKTGRLYVGVDDRHIQNRFDLVSQSLQDGMNPSRFGTLKGLKRGILMIMPGWVISCPLDKIEQGQRLLPQMFAGFSGPIQIFAA